jgi:carboxyl-terminal processing protease
MRNGPRPTRRNGYLRFALLIGTAFLAGGAAVPLSGLLGKRVGVASALAESNDRVERQRLLTLFGDALRLVHRDYVDPVNDKDLIENAIDGMLTGLDPHSSYLNATAFRDLELESKGEFGGLGIEVAQDNGSIKVVSRMDHMPAARAGVNVGDIITAVDGTSLRGLSLDAAVDRLRGAPNTRVSLTIRRAGANRPLQVSMLREIIHVEVVKAQLLADNVGYIRLAEFTEPAEAGIRRAVRRLKAQAGGALRALILDLRNNPGGLLDQAVAVASDFLDQGEIVSTRARHPEDSERWAAKGRDILGGLPMVVLIDGGSASASEIVAGALQDHQRAVLVGTRSFGKGSVQTVIPLPNGGALDMTTARYFTPSGRSIQALGIEPDVTVSESREPPHLFGDEREADLNHVLSNAGAVDQPAVPVRLDLSPIAKAIPEVPPANFPALDPAKPDETDFQLQQALAVARAMTLRKRVSAD